MVPVALIAFVLVSALLYDAGMNTLERRPRSFTQSLEWAVGTVSTTGYGGDTAWFHPAMVLLVIVVQLISIFFVPIIIVLYLIPFLSERFEQRVPRKAGDKLANHVIVFRYGPAVETLLQRLGSADVPSLVVELDEVAGSGHPGAADEDVDGAALGGDGGKGDPDGFVVGYVERVGDGIDAGAGEFRHGRVEEFRSAGHDGDPTAAPAERVGRGEADAAGSSRDHRMAAGERAHSRNVRAVTLEGADLRSTTRRPLPLFPPDSARTAGTIDAKSGEGAEC
jgi:hypothetical protein